MNRLNSEIAESAKKVNNFITKIVDINDEPTEHLKTMIKK